MLTEKLTAGLLPRDRRLKSKNEKIIVEKRLRIRKRRLLGFKKLIIIGNQTDASWTTTGHRGAPGGPGPQVPPRDCQGTCRQKICGHVQVLTWPCHSALKILGVRGTFLCQAYAFLIMVV